jgi:hypothetical protein
MMQLQRAAKVKPNTGVPREERTIQHFLAVGIGVADYFGHIRLRH